MDTRDIIFYSLLAIGVILFIWPRSPIHRNDFNLRYAEKELFDRAYQYYEKGYYADNSIIHIHDPMYLNKRWKKNPSFQNVLEDSATEVFLSHYRDQYTTDYPMKIYIQSDHEIKFSFKPYLRYPFAVINATNVRILGWEQYYDLFCEYNSAIQEIHLPKDADVCFSFKACPNLQRIVLNNPLPPKNVYCANTPIEYCHEDIALYVPDESIELYKSNPEYTKLSVRYSYNHTAPLPIRPLSDLKDKPSWLQ